MVANGFGDVAERLRRSTVHLRAPGRRGGSGSGVIWSADGLIVTNAHVVRPGRMRVDLWDGRSYPASLESRDAGRDLAALSIETAHLPACQPRDTADLRVGEIAVAVGNPLGFTGALSTGIIQAAGPCPGLGRRNWVQASVRLAPGNSGGPLADAQGRVIGINTMIYGGLALAVPSGDAVRFLGRQQPPVALGVTVRAVRLRISSDPALGLVVLGIEDGSPAARASLLVGDILIAVNGSHFESVHDLTYGLEESGEVAHLRFVRAGSPQVRETTVQLRPWRREGA